MGLEHTFSIIFVLSKKHLILDTSLRMDLKIVSSISWSFCSRKVSPSFIKKWWIFLLRVGTKSSWRWVTGWTKSVTSKKLWNTNLFLKWRGRWFTNGKKIIFSMEFKFSSILHWKPAISQTKNRYLFFSKVSNLLFVNHSTSSSGIVSSTSRKKAFQS